MSNLVAITNGTVTTTSLNVAQTFEKQHDKIIRDIKNLLAQVPEKWGIANFGETPYTHPQNGQTYPMYTLTRDAFTLLAMGFTGKKAMQFKLAYIDAFNRMEAKLQNKQQALPQKTQDTNTEYSTKEDREHLRKLVGNWVACKNVTYSECWRIIHKEFNVPSVAMLRKNQLPAVCNFILDKINCPEKCPSLPSLHTKLTFLPVPAENKLPSLMFDYTPESWEKQFAEKFIAEYGYKEYAYNAYMLSCKANALFNDFEQKIKQLMKDYEKISKPVYKTMFGKVMDGDYDALHNTSGRDRHNECVNFTGTMWQTIDRTYSKLMYSKSSDLRNEVDQMIQTLRHTAKVLDM